MLKRRSCRGMNPTMATIMGTVQESTDDNIELGNKAFAKAFESNPPGSKAP